MKEMYGIVKDIGVARPVITSGIESIRDEIRNISGGLKNLERVQKKQCWQSALRCGMHRKG